jgi:hypothetical protein
MVGLFRNSAEARQKIFSSLMALLLPDATRPTSLLVFLCLFVASECEGTKKEGVQDCWSRRKTGKSQVDSSSLDSVAQALSAPFSSHVSRSR